MQTKQSHSGGSPTLYVVVWAALIFLTGVTVGVSYINLRNSAILMAVMIATLKALLVLLYFMHLRFGQPLLVKMIISATIIYGVFFGLTMVDYWYR